MRLPLRYRSPAIANKFYPFSPRVIKPWSLWVAASIAITKGATSWRVYFQTMSAWSQRWCTAAALRANRTHARPHSRFSRLLNRLLAITIANADTAATFESACCATPSLRHTNNRPRCESANMGSALSTQTAECVGMSVSPQGLALSPLLFTLRAELRCYETTWRYRGRYNHASAACTQIESYMQCIRPIACSHRFVHPLVQIVGILHACSAYARIVLESTVKWGEGSY